MSVTEDDVPQEIAKLCGEVQYEETSEIPVEHGYIWTSCASVENGNPIFWDEAAAEAITGGAIAPRAWSLSGSGPTTGRRVVRASSFLCRSTST